MSKKKNERRKALLQELSDYCINNNADPMDVIRPFKVVPEVILKDIDKNLNLFFSNENCNKKLASLARPKSDGTRDIKLGVPDAKDLQIHIINFKMNIIKRILDRVPEFEYFIKEYFGERIFTDFTGRSTVLYLCCEIFNIMREVECSVNFMVNNPFYSNECSDACSCCDICDILNCECETKSKEGTPDIDALKTQGVNIKETEGGFKIMEVNSMDELMDYIFGRK